MEEDLDDIYKRVLKRCTIRIKENLQGDYIVDRMTEMGFLDQLQINDYKSLELSSKKIGFLIDCIDVKGKEGVEQFINMLTKMNQTYLAGQLMSVLKQELAKFDKEKIEKEKEIADQEKQNQPRESFEDKRKESQFDGRIIDIEAEWFEDTINKHSEKIPEDKSGGVYTSGKYGEVYKYTEKGRGLIIKKMSCKNQDELLRYARQEISWGRLMHYAINPLLAVGEDTQTQTHYLMFPLPEKGVLTNLIAGDLQKIDSRDVKSLTLNQERRLAMLYQIVTALTYLHKAVRNFRGMVSHGWVCSENVVVDGRFNVRLTNFGKTREETADTEDLPEAVKQDYKALGMIVLELLTSHDRNSLVEALGNIEDLLKNIKDPEGDYEEKYIKAVWTNKKVREELKIVAEKYVEGQITKDDIEKQSKRNHMENLLRQQLDSDKWNGDRSSKDCDICVINPAIVEDAVLKHGKSSCKVVRVCVGCLRNSYINQIQCPECLDNIVSPIGQEWAAVLISGGEEDKEVQATFRADMTRVYEKITSQYPLIMGISKDSVYQICPGETKSPTAQLDEAFQDLQNKIKQNDKQITSLLVYYTGHYYKEDGCFLLDVDDDENEELLDPNQLQDKIQGIQQIGQDSDRKCCDRIVIFLDCCKAPQLTGWESKKGKRLPFIQFSSCSGEERAQAIGGEGSLFTSYLLKGLSGKAYKDKCLNVQRLGLTDGCQICEAFTSSNGFISIEDLTRYVDKHIHAYNTQEGSETTEAVVNLKDVNWKDATIAYFIDKQLDFEFCLQHGDKAEYKSSVHQLPDTMTALKEDLLTAFADADPIKLAGFSKADADILIISTSMGSGGADNSEDLVNVGQILGAWNLKCKLKVGLRPLKDMVHGKVGVVLEEEGLTVQTLLDVLKPCVKDEWVKQMGSSVQVSVPIMEEGLKKLYSDLQNKSQMKGAGFLTKKVQSIKNNKEIKKKTQGEVVIAFPNAQQKNFITFQFKEPKALNPRAGSSGPTAVPAE